MRHLSINFKRFLVEQDDAPPGGAAPPAAPAAPAAPAGAPDAGGPLDAGGPPAGGPLDAGALGGAPAGAPAGGTPLTKLAIFNVWQDLKDVLGPMVKAKKTVKKP